MARFAPVAPPQLLMALKKAKILGNYHLLLAHDVAAQHVAYAKVFDGINPSSVVIMDNSLIELGYPAPYEMMQLAIQAVPQTTHVVLPDKLGSADDTLGMSHAAHIAWKDLGRRYMGVVQGKDIEELLFCAQELSSWPYVKMLGIPRHVTKTLGSRFEITRVLAEQYYPDISIHLLGFSDDVLDDVASANLPCVGGIDSAVPIRLGVNGTYYIDPFIDPGPRGDYWEYNGPLTPQIVYNIADIRRRISHVGYTV